MARAGRREEGIIGLDSTIRDAWCSTAPLAYTNVVTGLKLIAGFSSESERTDCASEAWKNLGDDSPEPSARELGREVRPRGGVSISIGLVVTIFERSGFVLERTGLPPLRLFTVLLAGVAAALIWELRDGCRECRVRVGGLVGGVNLSSCLVFFNRGPDRGVILDFRNGPGDAEGLPLRELGGTWSATSFLEG